MFCLKFVYNKFKKCKLQIVCTNLLDEFDDKR